MAWKINVSKAATKQLKKLDRIAQKRILHFLKTKIASSENPRSQGKSLQGKKNNLWRYRVGDYRLICSIEDNSITVLVLAIGHRREIYRSTRPHRYLINEESAIYQSDAATK